MAQLLNQAGLAAEARAVLDEGLSRGLLNAGGSPTREIIAEIDRALVREKTGPKSGTGSAAQALDSADALVGTNRYSEAIALYRRALAEAGVDAPEVNVRLGRALVLAGQSEQAQAAFRSAADSSRPGPYSDLARFWLAWLSPRSDAPIALAARTPVDSKTVAGAPPRIAQGDTAESITVTGRRVQPRVEDEPEADDKIVCRIEKVTRSRLTGRTCRTVAEWRIHMEREQDYARDVAEDAFRRDRRPRRD
jgi:tetratricopeptide (TPR) repeat protein